MDDRGMNLNGNKLKKWCETADVGMRWLSCTIGRSGNYLSSCVNRGRIGKKEAQKVADLLVHTLRELTEFDVDEILAAEPEEVEVQKPEGVNESRVSWEEFHGYAKKEEEKGKVKAEEVQAPEYALNFVPFTRHIEQEVYQGGERVGRSNSEQKIYLKRYEIVYFEEIPCGTRVWFREFDNLMHFDVVEGPEVVARMMG